MGGRLRACVAGDGSGRRSTPSSRRTRPTRRRRSRTRSPGCRPSVRCGRPGASPGGGFVHVERGRRRRGRRRGRPAVGPLHGARGTRSSGTSGSCGSPADGRCAAFEEWPFWPPGTRAAATTPGPPRRRSPPAPLERLAGAQHHEAVARVEGVGRAGHGLDGEAAAAPVRGQRVAGEDHDVGEGRVHPERRGAAVRRRETDPGEPVGLAREVGEAVVEDPPAEGRARAQVEVAPRPGGARPWGCRARRPAASSRRARGR